MTKSIIVTSGKGGTGKTSLCAGVGAAISLLGRSCLVIDADAGLRSLDLTLGVHETALFDFFDVYTGRVEIEDACAHPEGLPNLCLLSAPAFSVSGGLPKDSILKVVEKAREKEMFDYILIDSPAGLGSGFSMAADSADSAIVVSGTDRVSLRCAEKTALSLAQHDVTDSYLVVNRVRRNMLSQAGALNIDDAMDLSGLPLLGYVPEDDAVYKSLLSCSPLLTNVKEKKYSACRAYKNIARRILGEHVKLMRK